MCFFHGVKMLELVDLLLDSSYAANTAQPGFSSKDTPQFVTNSTIKNVQSLKVAEVSVPISYHAITDDSFISPTFNGVSLVPTTQYNNGLTLSYAYGAATTIDLYPGSPEGNLGVGTYDVVTLCSTLTALFNTSIAAWPAPFVAGSSCLFSYSAITGKITFRLENGPGGAGGPVPNDVLLLKTQSRKLAEVLGLNQVVIVAGWETYGFGTGTTLPGGVFTFEFPNFIEMEGPSVLYVNSRKLGPLVRAYLPTGPFVTGESNTQICSVPATSGYTEILNWQDQQGDFHDLHNLFQLQDLDLYITAGTFTTPLKFNGLPFQVRLQLLLNIEGDDAEQGTAENSRVVKRLRPY